MNLGPFVPCYVWSAARPSVLKWPTPLRWLPQAYAGRWRMGARWHSASPGWMVFLPVSFMGPVRVRRKKPAAVCLDGFNFGSLCSVKTLRHLWWPASPHLVAFPLSMLNLLAFCLGSSKYLLMRMTLTPSSLLLYFFSFFAWLFSLVIFSLVLIFFSHAAWSFFLPADRVLMNELDSCLFCEVVPGMDWLPLSRGRGQNSPLCLQVRITWAAWEKISAPPSPILISVIWIGVPAVAFFSSSPGDSDVQSLGLFK